MIYAREDFCSCSSTSLCGRLRGQHRTNGLPRDTLEDKSTMHTQSTTMSKSEQIRTALLTRYPCMEIPPRIQQPLAEEFGVTKQMVSVIVRRMNYKVHHVESLICDACGGPKLRLRALCHACREAAIWLTVTCDICGVSFQRRLSDQLRATEIGNRGRTTQQILCSTPCRIKAMGEKIRAVRAVKKWNSNGAPQPRPSCPDCGGPKAMNAQRCRQCFNARSKAIKNGAA